MSTMTDLIREFDTIQTRKSSTRAKSLVSARQRADVARHVSGVLKAAVGAVFAGLLVAAIVAL